MRFPKEGFNGIQKQILEAVDIRININMNIFTL